MVRNTLLLVREHSGRYKAFIRFCIAAAQLWTERRRSPYHDVPARLLAMRDFLRGRYGPPPRSLVEADRAVRASTPGWGTPGRGRAVPAGRAAGDRR